MNMPTPLLKSQPPPTPTLQTPPCIRTAGPEGNPFYNIHWLAKEDIENQTQTHIHTHTTNMAHSPPPKLWYLPNHRDALQAHMHFLHKLGLPKLKQATMRTIRPSQRTALPMEPLAMLT